MVVVSDMPVAKQRLCEHDASSCVQKLNARKGSNCLVLPPVRVYRKIHHCWFRNANHLDRHAALAVCTPPAPATTAIPAAVGVSHAQKKWNSPKRSLAGGVGRKNAPVVVAGAAVVKRHGLRHRHFIISRR